MHMHPMYRRLKPNEKSHLWQGDLIHREMLVKTGALAGHQDYMAARSDFPAFCVITQTCDLMPKRRVDFITLAVVRKLKSIFSQSDATGDRKNSTYSLLEKIINHRENKGFFYLHPIPPLIIENGAVVDLRTSFALHSRQHYEQIRGCRKASLAEVFAHKLGWMAGYLFSRVPNKEWDQFEPSNESKEFVKSRKFVEMMLDEIKTRTEAEKEIPLFSFDSAIKHLTPKTISNLSHDEWKKKLEQLEILRSRFAKNKPSPPTVA